MRHARSGRRPLMPALAAALLLAACGGGDDGGEELATDVAQGYAADAVTMSVAGTTAVDASADVLESAVAAAPATAQREQLLAAQAGPAASTSLTAACPTGGSVSWTVTGDAATIGNGQLDAGETFAVVYNACGTAGGGSIDGSATITVTARSASLLAFTHATNALTQTTTNGTFVHSGSVSVSRSEAALGGGGREVTRRVTSPGVTLQSSIGTVSGTRVATYQLNALDWSVTRTYGSSNELTARSHQGSVSITASTPRRPSATLDITAQGTLTLDGAGVAAAEGSFTVVSGRHKIRCLYGAGIATLTLDLGNDGTVDRTWVVTLTRLVGDAG